MLTDKDEMTPGYREGWEAGREAVARLCDEAANRNRGGDSMDEGEAARMWGRLTSQAERLADAARACPFLKALC
jgi:hypothetical protein